MRTVSDILNTKQKPVNVIGPKELVIDALKMMDVVNLSYLIVMEGETYKGIFSERDYTRNVVLKGRNSSSASVDEVMTIELPVVGLSDTVEHCMEEIIQQKTRYLLACDKSKNVLGVITIHDLLRQVFYSKADVFDSTLAEQLIEQEESNIY